MADYMWHCDRCCASGEIRIADDAGVWEGAELILEMHRMEDHQCKGGANTVRVYGQPKRLSLLMPRKQAVASGRARPKVRTQSPRAPRRRS